MQACHTLPVPLQHVVLYQAADLQQKLLDRARQRWEAPARTSWLAEWWNTRGYLEVCRVVLPNNNVTLYALT
jgi:hypothetical protein